MRFARIFGLLLLLAIIVTGVLTISNQLVSKAQAAGGVPHYDHIFVVMNENHNYVSLIGNPNAPTINKLAKTYGLATNYTGVGDPSAPNYVGLVGGSTYGIADDNAYYTHTINQSSIADQLENAHLTWHGYFQSMPYAGYMGTCFPTKCNGVPDSDTLYASKHNGFPYFAHIQNSRKEQLNMVPITQLNQDLANNSVPNFGLIVPDQCDDMHGAPPYCVDSGNPGDPNDNILVSQGDTYTGSLVNTITGSTMWSHGNNAIVITWDEGNTATERVVTIVITNHGPRGIQDATSYNHYSLLLTIEDAFGLGCLQHACDASVKPMALLFAIS